MAERHVSLALPVEQAAGHGLIALLQESERKAIRKALHTNPFGIEQKISCLRGLIPHARAGSPQLEPSRKRRSHPA
jgi:hypothetical protein